MMEGVVRTAGILGATVCLLAAPNPAAWSQEVSREEVGVSLAEALELAGRANPEILAQQARAEAEVARLGAVERAVWPRLSLATGWSRTDTPALVFAQKMNAGELTQSDLAIEALELRKAEIEKAILDLKANNAPSPAPRPVRHRKRKARTAAQRKAQSRRMKGYWKERKAKQLPGA